MLQSNDSNENPYDYDQIDPEIRFRALGGWWTRHLKSFSLWYLKNSPSEQILTLTQCVEMPKSMYLIPYTL